MFLVIGFPFYIGKWRGDWILTSWSHMNVFYLKYILGISVETKGLDILKKQGPCIIACQHQSAFETVTFFRYCTFAFVYKEQLNNIPIYGYFMRKSGMILVNREQGAKSLKDLLKGGKKAIEERGGIIIFPEGTRIPVGQVGQINPGLWALYQSLKIPVIPVTLNSGLYWPAKKFLKYPGTIEVNFHEPFDPGLSREEFEEKLQALYYKK